MFIELFILCKCIVKRKLYYYNTKTKLIHYYFQNNNKNK